MGIKNNKVYSMEKDRRNLLFLSFLIIAYIFVDISITEINILGNTATIKDPFSLKILIVLVWLYFLYRYYQYFISNKPFGLLSAFYNKADEYSQKVLYETLNSRNIEGVRIDKVQYSSLTKDSLWSYKYSIGVQDKMGGYKPAEKEERISLITLLPTFIKAWIYVGVNNENFSEYILPFIIAIGAFVSIVIQIIRL